MLHKMLLQLQEKTRQPSQDTGIINAMQPATILLKLL
jgi:hypothetical protein